MDPVTAIANAIAAGLNFGCKVWDSTPPEARAAEAAALSKAITNSLNFLLSLQDKINAAVAAK